MGRVVQAFPHARGFVRSVEVLTKYSIGRRPISKLCLLVENSILIIGIVVFYTNNQISKYQQCYINEQYAYITLLYLFEHFSSLDCIYVSLYLASLFRNKCLKETGCWGVIAANWISTKLKCLLNYVFKLCCVLTNLN